MALNVTIWHNPRCSKSRATLALLHDHGYAPEVRLYLADPPSEAEIREALARLGISAQELVRRREAAFDDAGLGANSTDDVLVAAMSTYPILIERPVVFANCRAAVGRPPEAVLDIL